MRPEIFRGEVFLAHSFSEVFYIVRGCRGPDARTTLHLFARTPTYEAFVDAVHLHENKPAGAIERRPEYE
jgi:hypothetical protein